jgi:hypothetical protein
MHIFWSVVALGFSVLLEVTVFGAGSDWGQVGCLQRVPVCSPSINPRLKSVNWNGDDGKEPGGK